MLLLGKIGSSSKFSSGNYSIFIGLLKNSSLVRAKTTDSSYQFIHKSKLPTLHFQSSLPRLPIPELSKTCERYLSAVEPILSSEELKNTKSIVSSFSNGVGQDLQHLLKTSDASNKHTSYISQPWFDMYLSDRSPLPVNYNPLLVMKHDQKAEYNNQLIRSANLVISSLRFMKSLENNILEPEVFHMNPSESDTERFRQITRLAPKAIATYVAYAFKAFPLDMSQYHRLFGVTRIPKISKDILFQAEKSNSRHIVIIRGGKYFAVDVLTENGDIVLPDLILGRLKKIMDDNLTGEIVDKNPVGLMTTANRDTWAKTRQHLLDTGNKSQLDQIDSALFCLALDGEHVKYDDCKPQTLVKQLLAGDGTNRWFDKSISLIVSGDGTAAVNFEHSWGDGVAVLRYFNEIYKDSIEQPQVHPETVPILETNTSSIRPIIFELDDRATNDILKASQKHNQIMASLDLNVLRYKNGINKKSCKRSRVSPDSIMQLAFQLAYKQAFGSYVGSYESCSTAAFRHGRTETMRPCTMATKAFCDFILTNNQSKIDNNSALREMIQKCSSIHNQLTKDAAMGQGFDRHLFGLRHMAEINGIDIPELYRDQAFKRINYNIISTSTLSSSSVLAGCFGPVVADGIGIAYSIQDEECGAIAATYNGQCNGSVFIDSLNDAFNKIRDILDK